MKLELTWPHNVLITVCDPDMSVPQITAMVAEALANDRHFTVTAKDRTIIVPKQLLRSALIDIKQ